MRASLIAAALLASAALTGTTGQAAAQANHVYALFPGTQSTSGAYAADPNVARSYPQSMRAMVADPTGAKPGVITIDTAHRYLYLSLGHGEAMRYGVGVGREGFLWHGTAHIGRKAEWPGWTPPRQMLLRRPDLPRHMAGGIDNPLGARAMYLFEGHRDTMFRIHGSNEPWTIGHAVSSGCIRMLNADVKDLYSRVHVGTTVHVL